MTEQDNTENLPFKLPEGDEFAVVWLDDKKGYKISMPNGALLYIPNFLTQEESSRALAYLLATDDEMAIKTDDLKGLHEHLLDRIKYTNIPWKQEWKKHFQNVVKLPRLTSWHGDANTAYMYSGILNNPNPWNPCLEYIKTRVEAIIGREFNSVLLNWYRDESDSVGWHSDDEPELGKNPIIASVSLGETRSFVLRLKYDHAIKIKMELEPGSLLVMAGATQQQWEHSIPKRTKKMGSRVNLTYRKIYPDLRVGQALA